MVVSLVIMLATFYGGYAVLADDQKENSEDLVTLQVKSEALGKDVNLIRRDVDVIKVEQKHLTEAFKEQKNDIKYIRSFLERNYPNGN